MAGKAGKVWSLPRFPVSIRSYKKQPVKKYWSGILDLAWLKFAVAALVSISPYLRGLLFSQEPRGLLAPLEPH
jgi:hypothetical protein